jgi:REP element-mobilizing transposase RayT
MPRSRSSQISLIDTPFYHCVSRCVRRSFLCGIDNYSGQSFEHRRAWVQDRILFLTSVLAIDICAYAVMSNHIHVVVHINKVKAINWSTSEVVERWHQLHNGTLLTQKYHRNETLTESEQITFKDTVEVYRVRVYNISWLMRDLNEYIAREANKEDGCSGRFWEGRFKSQALLDEAAILSCMAYVDLNPIRANIADKSETSKYTSIKRRLESIKQPTIKNLLLPFINSPRPNMPSRVTFPLKDYCELVDMTGRIIREGKASYIDHQHQPIPQRLGLSNEQWMTLSTEFEKHFCYAAGGEK